MIAKLVKCQRGAVVADKRIGDALSSYCGVINIIVGVGIHSVCKVKPRIAVDNAVFYERAVGRAIIPRIHNTMPVSGDRAVLDKRCARFQCLIAVTVYCDAITGKSRDQAVFQYDTFSRVEIDAVVAACSAGGNGAVLYCGGIYIVAAPCFHTLAYNHTVFDRNVVTFKKH